MGFLDTVIKSMPVVGPLIGGAFDMLGASQANKASQNAANTNAQMQREFAQNGIRWKVADAKAAGIHPLAALGANTTSFSPVSVGYDDGFSRMGQNITRAMNAAATASERVLSKLKLEQERERLKNMQITNMGLLKDLNEIKPNPAMPDSFQKQTMPGQGNALNQLGVDNGLPDFYKDAAMPDGTVFRMKGKAAEEALEDDPYGNIDYAILSTKQRGGLIWSYLNPGKAKSSMDRDMLRLIRPRKRRKGWEFRYDPWMGKFVHRQIHKKSKLYDVPDDHKMSGFINGPDFNLDQYNAKHPQ